MKTIFRFAKGHYFQICRAMIPGRPYYIAIHEPDFTGSWRDKYNNPYFVTYEAALRTVYKLLTAKHRYYMQSLETVEHTLNSAESVLFELKRKHRRRANQ